MEASGNFNVRIQVLSAGHSESPVVRVNRQTNASGMGVRLRQLSPRENWRRFRR